VRLAQNTRASGATRVEYTAPKVFIVDILKCGLVTFLIDVVLYVLYELLKMAFIKIKWIFLIN